MRCAVARNLLREKALQKEVSALQKKVSAAFSTTSEASSPNKNDTPTRTLSSAPLPQRKESLESNINIVTSTVPGPKSTELRQKLLEVQQMSSVVLISDLEKSSGNYFTDVDGNTYLDAFMQIASLPLGYNNEALQKVLTDPKNVAALTNRTAMGWYPDETWVQRLHNVFMSCAPKGMDQVYPMMCGTCSNENAIKLMFMKHMQKQRGGRVGFTQEELDTTMINQAPGSPKLSILSFKGCFHGRTVGLLSCSNSRPIHGVDIPTLPWPKADFPLYKYPLEEFVRENAKEDERCLATVEEQIEKQAKEGIPVAGVIIEPIQAEGGDNHGSKEFFQGLEKIVQKHDIPLLMDEVQTGGGSTGKMWAHEWFELEHGPDALTFSKKMLSGGIYHKSTLRPDQAGRIVNTWVGDPHKVMMLEAVLKEMKSQDLLGLSQKAGDVMLNGMKDLERRFPGLWNAARGLGTFVAVDCPTAEIRDTIVSRMRSKGVLTGGCGESAIRLRPALIFEPKHAEIMLEKFEEVLTEMEQKH